jgi:osmotically-inducible protein OsmY
MEGEWTRGPHAGKGPKGYQRSDERIREAISDELTDHPEIDASEIEIEVKKGEVTLTGTVDSREAKRMTEDVAEQSSGVQHVSNQLRVRNGRMGASDRSTEGSTSGRSSSSGSRKEAR